MSSNAVVIEARSLSKSYRLYDRPQDRLKQTLSFRLQQLRLAGLRTYYKEFWALRDVSFDIGKAETVGIVGRNGSGKSTLLQLICGTLQPTSGACTSRGAIAALLELGTGFNPQFSGMENVYLNGQILGLSKREIDSRLEDILSFADLGDFIYQPVKTYSSGMAVRLAFAIAAVREPEILVIDEALAVGDDAFRRKCFARLRSLQERGTTLLFVSHTSALVLELCDRALLLDGGELLFDGSPKDTISLYTKLLFASPDVRPQLRRRIMTRPAQELSTASSSAAGPAKPVQPAFFAAGLVTRSRVEYEMRGACIEEPHLETVAGELVNVLSTFDTYRYCYRVRFTADAGQVQFGMLIKTVTGKELGGHAHPGLHEDIGIVRAGEVYSVSFEFRCLLNEGTFFLNAGVRGVRLCDGEQTYLHRILDAVVFKVLPAERPQGTGVVAFEARSQSERAG